MCIRPLLAALRAAARSRQSYARHALRTVARWHDEQATAFDAEAIAALIVETADDFAARADEHRISAEYVRSLLDDRRPAGPTGTSKGSAP